MSKRSKKRSIKKDMTYLGLFVAGGLANPLLEDVYALLKDAVLSLFSS